MAIDEVPQSTQVTVRPEDHSHTGAFVAIIVVLALLAAGEIGTLRKMSSMRGSFEAQQARMRTDLLALEDAQAQQLGALRAELDQTAERMGSTGKELNSARAMVTKLQKQQRQEATQLKQEISKKADEEKVGALSQDVTTTKTDLDATKKNVDELANNLGLAKSEMGTLIARNHDDIEALRKLGERDYFEFTLNKNQKQNIAGVGLTLKKTNAKHHRFDVTMLVDDQQIEKKARTINEPIFFYVAGSKKPYEMVVNKVESSRVTGYVSTPKGATEQAAAREGGGR